MTTGSTPTPRITLYDTTLRDGLGMEGLSLSLQDKLTLAQKLADLGVHYIEGATPARTRRTRSSSSARAAST